MPSTQPEPLPDAEQQARAMRVLGQFRQVFNAVRTHFHKIERQAGVGGAQVWALAVIRDNPGLSIGGLTQHLKVRQPTASNLVKSLVTRGMVEATRSGVDKRHVQLAITTAGLSAVSRAPGPASGVLPHALANLTPEALQQLELSLAGLVTQLKADEQATLIPLSELVSGPHHL